MPMFPIYSQKVIFNMLARGFANDHEKPNFLFSLRSSLSKMILLLNIARICGEHRGTLKTQPKILAFCQNSERL